MFIKPFKIKSNVQLRSSDLKKFRLRVEENFPNAGESSLINLFPPKSTLSQIKITCLNSTYTVYAIAKRPLFFEDEVNLLIPTVYALWNVPDMLPYFTTYTSVLPKLANGADLMLPGVIRKGSGMNAYGRYKKDQLVAVNLDSNKSAVGVGRLARSSDDLYMSGGYGTCVKMLHVFGDKLWSIEPSVVIQIPNNKPVIIKPSDEDFPELTSTNNHQSEAKQNHMQQNITGDHVMRETIENKNITNTSHSLEIYSGNTSSENVNDNLENQMVINDKNTTIESNMDIVLKNAFLKVLKLDGKCLSLPLLTSNFYRLHIVPAASKKVDLKQTTYKKLSKFLSEMSKQGLISIIEETKGIEKITSINFNHPDVINFTPVFSTSTENDIRRNNLFHTQMTELYVITDATLLLFKDMNYVRGDGVQGNQVKKCIKEYISKNKLKTGENSKIINLDKTLMAICEMNECTIDQIYHAVLNKMDYIFKMCSDNSHSDRVIISGMRNISGTNKPPIQMQLATRSGNKKVTIVSNLEYYGIIIPEFANKCKIGAAASTSIIKSANHKNEQLQIQGNQVRFVYDLLTETYKIPPRQIHGLELAKKEKKKKK